MEEPTNPYATPKANPTVPAQSIDPNDPLASFSDSQVKKIRNNSHSIKSIGILACLGVLYAFANINSGRVVTCLAYSINTKVYYTITAIIATVGAYALLARPSWGKSAGITYCILIILYINPFICIIGILGIIALISSQQLFGLNRISHNQADTEHQLRKKKSSVERDSKKRELTKSSLLDKINSVSIASFS